MKTVVYWGAAWRADQKEVARREAIAAKGIEDFFRTDTCFSVQSISRTVDGRNVLLLSRCTPQAECYNLAVERVAEKRAPHGGVRIHL